MDKIFTPRQVNNTELSILYSALLLYSTVYTLSYPEDQRVKELEDRIAETAKARDLKIYGRE
jgi:hypothetical protein